jgi:hypothetical protein
MQKTCPSLDRGTYWDVDPTNCSYIDFDATSLGDTKWWARGATRPNVYFMHPHVCDRDYERLDGYTPCAPIAATIRQSGVTTDALNFDMFYRAHNLDGSIPIAKMPFYNESKYGFLGVKDVTSDALLDTFFQPCLNIGQCYASPFTRNFRKAQRALSPAQNYTENDVFKCGSVGYESQPGICSLDPSVTQLYTYLCVQMRDHSICTSLIPDIITLCSAVQPTYNLGYSDASQNVQAYAALFSAFPTPTDLSTYLQTTACIDNLYSSLQASTPYTNLYYPLDFSLYELPFDWFYQCLIMTTTDIDPTSRLNQDCHAYRNRLAYAPTSYTPGSSSGDPGMSYLRFVRAYYTQAYINDAIVSARVSANATLTSTIERLIIDVYNGVDTTYPRCSSNRKWRFSGITPEESNLLDIWYTNQVCSTSWLEDSILRMNRIGFISYSLDNWIDILADPDMSSLLTQSGWSSPTLLELIKSDMLQQITVSVVEYVMGNNPAPQGSTLVSRYEGILVMNALSDGYTQQIPDDLDPSFTDVIGAEIEWNDYTIPHVCAYMSFAADPALADIRDYTTCSMSSPPDRQNTFDNIIACGNPQKPTYCTFVPLFYQIFGSYSCGYYPQLSGTPCTSISSIGCGSTLLSALYSRIRTAYPTPPNQPLQPLVPSWMTSSSFSFSLADLLDYEGNIMPDKSKSIMCVINTANPVTLLNCSNPHYESLKRHVRDHLMKPGSVIVPSNSQLDWRVDRSYLQAGHFHAYTSTNRSIDQRYLEKMFDDDSACKGSITTHICWRASAGMTWNTLNPWHLGYWNPFEHCDINYADQSQLGAEYIDATCNQDVCTPSYESNMPFSSTCSAKYKARTGVASVPRMDEYGQIDYNLCHHRLVEDAEGCLHDQSLLGGLDGLSVGSTASSGNMLYSTKYASETYEVAQSLYEPSTWSIPADFAQGMFSNTNPLWYGGYAPYGFLRVPPLDIGTHKLGFIIERVDNSSSVSSISIYKLPLTTSDDGLDLDSPLSTSSPVSQWVPYLRDNMQSDHDAFFSSLTHRYILTTRLGFDCPLRRYAFYSSATRGRFTPIMPSPRKSYHVFRNVTLGLFAHPTMTRISDGRYIGAYKTANGYCFCPDVLSKSQTQCRIPIGLGLSDPCSLRSTIKALLDGSVQTSVAHTPLGTQGQYQPCTMTLDWPYIPNNLRDGSSSPGDFTLASDRANKRCHVLDRLRPFQFKYVAVSQFPPSQGASACRTRRVSTLPSTPSTSPRCVRDGTLDTRETTSHRCARTTTITTLPRRLPTAPCDTVSNAKRRRKTRCNACSNPPTFKTQARVSIDPESSFGIPHRLSTERMLAKDLRDAICKTNPNCDALFNRSSWAKSSFMRNYLLYPRNLFVNATSIPKAAPKTYDDSKKWLETPWVYCPDRTSLSSSQNCQGTIPRDTWVTQKTSICPSLIRQLAYANGTNDPLAKVPFCMADNTTSFLCRQVAEAQRIVQKVSSSLSQPQSARTQSMIMF